MDSRDTSKKKNKRKAAAGYDMQSEIERMKEERRKYYNGLEEIEKLKQEFYQPAKTKSEEIRSVDEMLTMLTSAKDSHPGRKIFKKKHKFQCFTLDSLLAENGKDRDDYFELTLMLRTKLLGQETLAADALSELFYFMSMENDDMTCQSCYEILLQNIHTWTPTIEEVFKVILNWGATYNTLELTDCEKAFIFPNYIYLKLQSVDSFTGFCSFNYGRTFKYLTAVVSQTDKFCEREKIVLAKFTMKIALDHTCQPILNALKDLIVVCINSIEEWDQYKVVQISSFLFDKNEHFHNNVALLMDVLPKMNQCSDINACLSLTVLRSIITQEVRFDFPFENTEIAKLIRMIEINPSDGKDLYKLYIIIHFLNHIVYHRNIVKGEQAVLDDLKNSVESLKWEVAKSKRVFDADLLKGRISYCSTVWSLFSKRTVTPQIR